MSELYGIEARVLKADAQTPVESKTVVVFVGTPYCSAAHYGVPQHISSYEEYLETFHGGVEPDVMLSLDLAAEYALKNIKEAWFVNGSDDGGQDTEMDAGIIEDILKDALAYICLNSGDVPNIICLPCQQDSDLLATLVSECKGGINNLFYAQGFVDCAMAGDQLNAYNKPVSANIEVPSTDGCLVASWGDVVLARDANGEPTKYIPGSIVMATQRAMQDANNTGNVPYRSIGNIRLDCKGLCIDYNQMHNVTSTVTLEANGAVKVVMNASGYTDYSGLAELHAKLTTDSDPIIVNEIISMSNGTGTTARGWSTATGISDSPAPVVGVTVHIVKDVVCQQEKMNELAEDGIISLVNKGNNRWYTWGDHTAAVSNGAVDDETYRFDSTVAVLYSVLNRFILKWGEIIDSPMSLRIRDCIVNEEQDHLNSLKAMGCVVGDPKCEFRAIDNNTDTLGKGQFYFLNLLTCVPPAKYVRLNVQYTDAGLAAYINE